MCISDFNFNGYLSPEIPGWTKNQQFDKNEFYSLCIELNRFAQKTLYKLEIHNEDVQELLVSTLFIRCLGIFQASIISIEKGMIIEAKILTRSFLEILFRLRAISISKDNAIDFIRQHYVKIKKHINKLNSLSKKTQSKIKLSELPEKYKEVVNEIESSNIKEHGPSYYAQKAKLMDIYNTAYSLFSDQVHSNVSDLESYLVIENDKVISFNHGPTKENLNEVLNTLSESMIYILEDLSITFKLDISTQIKYFGKKSNKLSNRIINNSN